MKDVFGLYNLRCRISVGIIFLAPLLIEGYILIPEIRNISSTFIVSVVTYSLSGLIIVVSRKYGGKAFMKCFPEGLPAQQSLISSNNIIDSISKQRYCNFLEKNINNLDLSPNAPNLKGEANSAINWLIEQTRDSAKFPLISEENMILGFSYNLLGLKPFAILQNTILLIVNILFIVFNYKRIIILSTSLLICCLVTTILFMLIWILIINKALVISCGKKYARALLSACDSPELNKK